MITVEKAQVTITQVLLQTELPDITAQTDVDTSITFNSKAVQCTSKFKHKKYYTC